MNVNADFRMSAINLWQGEERADARGGIERLEKSGSSFCVMRASCTKQ